QERRAPQEVVFGLRRRRPSARLARLRGVTCPPQRPSRTHGDATHRPWPAGQGAFLMIRRFAVALCAASLIALAFGCSGKTAQKTAPGASGTPGAFKIGIMTGTVSQGEEDFRGGEQVAARYPGRVK